MLKTWNQIEYREAGTGDNVVIIFPGGHMRAGSDSGESYFVDNGYKVLLPSRPGYGKTPLDAGPDIPSFVDKVAQMLNDLHIKNVIVVGISASGPTALQFTERHPELTKALILQSALGHDGWPDAKTKRVAHFAFNHVVEGFTWFLMRWSFTLFPLATLKMMLASLSTKKPDEALLTIRGDQRTVMISVLKQSRSGRGFLNDLTYSVCDVSKIKVPTLIIHSKYDASVDVSHPEYLAEHIQNAKLFMSDAENHMIWYSDYYPDIEAEMAKFLGQAAPEQ